MNKIHLLAGALTVVALTGAILYWQASEPPRTLEQAEQEEREIMAGTRRGRPAPAEVREERAEMAMQQRQLNEAEQLVTLFTRCHDAVKSSFVLTRNVTVDDGLLPPNGHLHLSTYRGERIVGISNQPPDPAYYAELLPPLSGSYVVSGTVRTGSGPSAHYQSYTCKIFAKPPLFLVRSVDVSAIR